MDQGFLPSRHRRGRPGEEGRQHSRRHHSRQTSGCRECGQARRRSRAMQAIIEYSLDGTILAANENILKMTGYPLEQTPGSASSHVRGSRLRAVARIPGVLAKLNRGERIEEEIRRVGEGGKDIWIQASYNPIFDLDKRVVKVVNFLSDVTGRVGAVNHIADGPEPLGRRRSRAPHRRRIHSRARTAAGRFQRFAGGAGTVDGGGQPPIRRRSAPATGEISTAADDLSRRTEQQASSLEETAAALEEITATVKKTAEGAKHARDIVSTAKVDADKSGEVVREAMAAMTGIDKSSKQISQIIGVIDEIAFQTNLLALERRGRGGARRRRRPRLRRRRFRSARARPALGRGGQGDQGPDFRFDRPGRSGRAAGCADRRSARTHRRAGGRDQHRHRRHRRQRPGTVDRPANRSTPRSTRWIR